jgi:hypothetical protein
MAGPFLALYLVFTGIPPMIGFPLSVIPSSLAGLFRIN